MNIQIETILSCEDAVKIVNSAISYTNTCNSLSQVKLRLHRRIIQLRAHREFICGIESNHVWLSYKKNGSRILLITK